MESAEWLGLVGGAIGTFGFVPQVIRVFKLRSAREISLLWSFSFMASVGCWLTYGILLGLTSVMLWSSISVALGSSLIYAKLKYGRGS